LNIFDIFRNIYIETNFSFPKYNSKLLNDYVEQGNNILIEITNDVVKKDFFNLILFELIDELEYYRQGFIKYNSGTGKAYVPDLLFINIFFNPFIIIPPHDNDKYEVHLSINDEIIKSRLRQRFDAMYFIRDFSDHLREISRYRPR